MKSKRNNIKDNTTNSRLKKHKKNTFVTSIKSKKYKRKSTKTKKTKHLKSKNKKGKKHKGGAVIGSGGFGCAIDSLSKSLILDNMVDNDTITKLFTGGVPRLRISPEDRQSNIIKDFNSEISIFEMLEKVNSKSSPETNNESSNETNNESSNETNNESRPETSIFEFLPRMLNHIKIIKKSISTTAKNNKDTKDNKYTIYKKTEASNNNADVPEYSVQIGVVTNQNNQNLYTDINKCLGMLPVEEFYGIQMNKLGNCELDTFTRNIYRNKDTLEYNLSGKMINIINKLSKLFIKMTRVGLIHNDIKSDNVRLSIDIEGFNCQAKTNEEPDINKATFYLIDIGYLTNYFVECIQYHKDGISTKEYTINIIKETPKKYEHMTEQNMVNYNTIDILLYFNEIGSQFNRPPEISIYLLICLAYCIKQVLLDKSNEKEKEKAKQYIQSITTNLGVTQFKIDNINKLDLELLCYEFKTIFTRVLLNATAYYRFIITIGEQDGPSELNKTSVFKQIMEKIKTDAKLIRRELIEYINPKDKSPDNFKNKIFEKYNRYLKNYLIGKPDEHERKLPGIFTKDLYSYAAMIFELPSNATEFEDENIKHILGTDLLNDYPRGYQYMNYINDLKHGSSCPIGIGK
jgi:hypothetical protein